MGGRYACKLCKDQMMCGCFTKFRLNTKYDVVPRILSCGILVACDVSGVGMALNTSGIMNVHSNFIINSFYRHIVTVLYLKPTFQRTGGWLARWLDDQPPLY